MLNNKGQSLVLFILIIPILLGIMALVIDVGQALNQKNELNNTIEFILEYALSSDDTSSDQPSDTSLEELNSNDSNLELEPSATPNSSNLEIKQTEIEALLNYNLKNNQNQLQIEDNTITISSACYVEGIFSQILNIKGFEIKSTYKGYFQDDQKVIKRIK